MSSSRKEYRRTWMSKKRKAERLKVLAARAVKLSDSESDELEGMEAVVMPKQLECPFACETYVANNSEDDSDSDSSNHVDINFLWDEVENECQRQSESDDDTVEFLVEDSSSLKQDLQFWASDCHITHSQLNSLLPILNKYHPQLCLTAKTLLKTPQAMQCVLLSGGDYMYFGVECSLNNVISDTSVIDIDEVHLVFNVDGVPLFSSSSYSLWPLLCYAQNIRPHKVFVIALYGGKTKPCDLKFLDEAIAELKRLLDEGIKINGKHLKCVLKMCVCDAPARAMVKCIKQFSGYYGCDKCSQKGKYVGRITYPLCDSPMRTDQSFRCCANVEHHMGTSPFSLLPVDMIAFFPIDYMHQVCLGVMKRLLICWTSGSKKFKLSSANKLVANDRLLSFRRVVTRDFCRKPRSLSDLSHWKATEFRTFLLYGGYFVMRKILKDEFFQHFLSFSVAMCILISETLSADSEHRQFAHDLLKYFVAKSAELYGEEFLVYNVHSLTHLSREVELFGKLDNSSAFIFENFMQQLKRDVRSAKNPVLQVARRLEERAYFCNRSSPVLTSLTCALESFSCQPPDNNGILEDHRCCQVVSIEREHVVCMLFAKTGPVYTTPCNSKTIGVYKVRLSEGVLKRFPLNTIAHKAMCYTDNEHCELIFIQLLHTL